ncbi:MULTISPECIES: hypothetical protein [unclassified Sphingomonas]|uniref:hypothetical protein n=1 Tax=unclassified Sphingomonas TaxID=196159 RepID=UPI0006FB322F|nr:MULTISPECIES: hypothetical protein [unclassified Sphingomonas]KQX24818.1 hypothetical protein ASD17_24170 [Sphingomonas sp. Root1294]KQY69806.1 hypothetical protein ASD39_24285 [Sphingomonas sp. Root50]KRB93920.1 hypothetical protein ASE22_24675 [Sphingomonas sp. Root720]
MDLLNIARSGLRAGETVAAAAASSIAGRHGVATVPAVMPAGAIPATGTYSRRPVRTAAKAKPHGGAAPAEEQQGEADPAEAAAAPVAAQDLYTASAAILRTERRMRGSLDLLA